MSRELGLLRGNIWKRLPGGEKRYRLPNTFGYILQFHLKILYKVKSGIIFNDAADNRIPELGRHINSDGMVVGMRLEGWRVDNKNYDNLNQNSRALFSFKNSLTCFLISFFFHQLFLLFYFRELKLNCNAGNCKLLVTIEGVNTLFTEYTMIHK